MNASIVTLSLIVALSAMWPTGRIERPSLPVVSDTLPVCAPPMELAATWAARVGARTHLRVLLPADYRVAPGGFFGSDAWAGADSSMLALFHAPRGSAQLPTPNPANTSECRGLLAGLPARIVIAAGLMPGGPRDTMYVWAAELTDTSASPLSALIFARSRTARDVLSAAASRAEPQQP